MDNDEFDHFLELPELKKVRNAVIKRFSRKKSEINFIDYVKNFFSKFFRKAL